MSSKNPPMKFLLQVPRSPHPFFDDDFASEWDFIKYEVIDPLPTWQWNHGVPVCTACQADREAWQTKVIHTLRIDQETCSCNCGSRPTQEVEFLT